MRKTFYAAVLTAALSGSMLLGGTASAASLAPAPAIDNCVSYKLVKGSDGRWKLVKVTSTSSACSSQPGSGGTSGSTSGTSTSGTTTTGTAGQDGTNNCPSTTGCTATGGAAGTIN